MKLLLNILITTVSIILIVYCGNILYNSFTNNNTSIEEKTHKYIEYVTTIISNRIPNTKADSILDENKDEKYLIIGLNKPKYQGSSPITKTYQTIPPNAQKIAIEKVNNVGYTFYLGVIDYPNNSSINDELKNQITNIINNAHFPQFLLNNLSIIMVNSLAASSLMYIETPNGWVKIDDFNPSFLSEGGLFTVYYGISPVILLNKQKVGDPTNLKGILTHELGHYIETQMKDTDWEEYYNLRGIPSQTPRSLANWYSSPLEDFAEAFKNTFTGVQVLTHYGLLESTSIDYTGNHSDLGPCMEIYLKLLINNSNSSGKSLSTDQVLENSTLQKCRKEHISNYASVVDEKTKKFVSDLSNRIYNQTSSKK